MPEPIYLDHNATTPILPEVAEVIRACWAEPGNPASQHEFGRQARRSLEGARSVIGTLLGAARDDGVLFTSGGTESNHIAIRSFLYHAQLSRPRGAKKPHLIVSAIEHPSIASLAKEMRRRGHKVDELPVDENGVIRANALPRLLQSDTAVVAVMLANNETGVLQPVDEIAATCATRAIPFHTDATQVAGKLPINFEALGAATMTVAAHKFNGPVGIGALVARSDVQLYPQMFGGLQQSGLRPGTESVAMAVGMCRALHASERFEAEEVELIRCAHDARLLQRAEQIRELRDRFECAIVAGWPAARIIGASVERLPNTSNIAFVGLDRQMLFMALDQTGVACSTGSACASGSSEVSPTLVAMGCPEAVLTSALRFSLGVTTTVAEVDEGARRILQCCNNLRRQKDS
jgi:cysteine desulfurase